MSLKATLNESGSVSVLSTGAGAMIYNPGNRKVYLCTQKHNEHDSKCICLQDGFACSLASAVRRYEAYRPARQFYGTVTLSNVEED